MNNKWLMIGVLRQGIVIAFTRSVEDAEDILTLAALTKIVAAVGYAKLDYISIRAIIQALKPQLQMPRQMLLMANVTTNATMTEEVLKSVTKNAQQEMRLQLLKVQIVTIDVAKTVVVLLSVPLIVVTKQKSKWQEQLVARLQMDSLKPSPSFVNTKKNRVVC